MVFFNKRGVVMPTPNQTHPSVTSSPSFKNLHLQLAHPLKETVLTWQVKRGRLWRTCDRTTEHICPTGPSNGSPVNNEKKQNRGRILGNGHRLFVIDEKAWHGMDLRTDERTNGRTYTHLKREVRIHITSAMCIFVMTFFCAPSPLLWDL